MDIEDIDIPVPLLFDKLARNRKPRIPDRNALRGLGKRPRGILTALLLGVLDDGHMAEHDIEKMRHKTCHLLSPFVFLIV